MRADIKNRWILALRSNEYDQGTGRLRDANDGYCCLGVLCDLAAQDGVGQWTDLNQRSYPEAQGIKPQWAFTPYGGGVEEEQETVLPLAVRRWAEIRDYNSSPTVNGNPLAWYNDNGLNFDAIAKLIDRDGDGL